MTGQVVVGQVRRAASTRPTPRPGGPERGGRAPVQLPAATVGRMAGYLRVLTARTAGPHDVVSSAELARACGVGAALLRKDVSFLGSHGVRGVGYHVGTLVDELRLAIGAHQDYSVAMVGAGNLGQALAGYGGFAARGLRITAFFDSDPRLIGSTVAGRTVQDAAGIPARCRELGVTIGVLAVPDVAAQAAADALIAGGVRSILNFAPVSLTVPDPVQVRRVDLAVELQILAFLQSQPVPAPPATALTGRTAP